MNRIVLSSLGLAAGILFGCGLLPTARAQDTARPTIIHSFDGVGGRVPGQLVLGTDGNFYGTTAYGGFGYYANQSQTGGGTVFRITPAGGFTTLYAFPGGALGLNPHDLIAGVDGNFYGLTSHGGANGYGTVFRMDAAGQVETIYSLPDSRSIIGPLVQDERGNFYGSRYVDTYTTHTEIFRLTQAGEYRTLYTFTGEEDGNTSGGLTRGSDGNFYGTSYNGEFGASTIYRITPAGAFTALHRFQDDEVYLASGLTLGSDGNFYGTIPGGGASSKGLVYRCSPTGEYTVLYRFAGGADGESPGGRLVEGKDGNFYGLTSGTNSVQYEPAVVANDAAASPSAIIASPPVPSTVYRVTPQGVFTSLYANNYYYPNAFSGFVLGNDGNFYGTSAYGQQGSGSVFELSIASHPAFFAYQAPLPDGLYYLSFASGNPFGYYTFSNDPNAIYHLDLGPEYVFDAADGKAGVYLYDFRSKSFFYTSPTFPFPYLYDFSLNTTLYYYPDPSNPGRYNTNGVRYFYNFATGKIITK